jgi:membrane-associated protease RseP (regulator of RpoE activity)
VLFAIGIVLFAVGILLSIALHEVGHLVPAKKFGVKVTQYMVGFGPTLWSTRRGETEYGLKWIPLGGYIRMIGMFPPGKDGTPRSGLTGMQALIADARHQSAAEVQPGDEDRVFWKLPVPKRLVIMFGGPVMNLVIAAVLFTITLTMFGTPEPTTSVARVSPCIVEVTADQATPPECTAEDEPTPAAAAGLQEGDTIVAYDGREPTSWEQLQDWIRSAPGQTVTLTMLRDGETLDVPVTLATVDRPPVDDPDGERTPVGFLGMTPSFELEQASITEVPGFMWDFAIRSGQAILSIPARMVGVWEAAFGGGERDPEGPIGVVGVSRIGGEIASFEEVPLSWKAADFLNLLASLNMALFLFNMIPLLPLDGGHIAGALYEGGRRQVARIRGRPDPGPVDVARMLPVAYSVAVLLIGMSALLLYADVVNPIRIGG